MWSKIYNLRRLKGEYLIVALKFYFKKFFKLNLSKTDHKIMNFYYSLVVNNYRILESNKTTIILKSDNDNVNICLRKFPSSDIDVFYQIFLNKEYEEVFMIANKYFKNKSIINIFDLGGNIGLTSLFFSNFFNNTKIITLEPDISNFEILLNNIKINSSINSTFLPLNAGIWSEDTKLKIVADFRDGLEWSFRVEPTNDTDGIQAFSIKSLQNKYNIETIDVLKIDVEGTEKLLFDVKKAELDFLKDTKIIAIEIHEEFCKKSDIFEVLKEYDFEYYEKGELCFAYNTNLIDN